MTSIGRIALFGLAVSLAQLHSALAGQHGERPRGDAPHGITNLGLASGQVAIAGDWAAFLVREDGTDLNGDGDGLDSVAHAVHLPTTTVRNLGLAARDVRTDGTSVVVAVDEFYQGKMDLNGDGDLQDLVVHVHELASGTTVGLGLALLTTRPMASVAFSHGEILFGVFEAAQGGDLDGDGDLADVVAHSFDRAARTTRNLELPLVPYFTYFPALAESESALAFGVSEAALGATDLNGDGDSEDVVLYTLEGTQPPRNQELAIALDIAFFEGRLWFAVEEAAQAALDLNADGDALDGVLHSWNGNAIINHGLASYGGAYAVSVAPGGLLAVVGVSEAAQGARDLNGDGDALDVVPRVLDFARDRATSIGMAAFAPHLTGFLARDAEGPRAQPGRPAVVLSVPELGQGGADLNDDGDANDIVPFIYDLRSGRSMNLKLAEAALGNYSDPSSDVIVALRLDEAGANEDANGDGDTDDVALAIVDAASGRVRNLGLATYRGDANLIAGFLDAGGRFAVFPVNEHDQGETDLNGDGDDDDDVLFVYDGGSNHVINTHLALASPMIVARSDDRLVVPISERHQGVDLNEDGDLFDVVLFLVDLRALR